MAKAIAFLVFLLISPAAYAVTYTVGGSSGWTTGFNYVNWGNGINFTTDDTLVFNYGPTHAVDEVTQANYQTCNSNNPISSDSNSPTTIALTTTGTRYFLCPRSNHCTQGQRLAVTVRAASTSPPGSSPPPPAGGSTPSPPTGGSTPSPPTGGSRPETPSGTPGSPPATTAPPSPSVATTLGGRSSLVVGLSLALVGLMGLMG